MIKSSNKKNNRKKKSKQKKRKKKHLYECLGIDKDIYLKLINELKYYFFGNRDNIVSRENMLSKIHKNADVYILTANPLYNEIKKFMKIINWSKYFKNVLYCDIKITSKYNIIKKILNENNYNIYGKNKLAALVDDSDYNFYEQTMFHHNNNLRDYTRLPTVIKDILISPTSDRIVLPQSNEILLKSGMYPYNNKIFGMNKDDCDNIVKLVKYNNIKFIFIDWDNTFQIYNGIFKFNDLLHNFYKI